MDLFQVVRPDNDLGYWAEREFNISKVFFRRREEAVRVVCGALEKIPDYILTPPPERKKNDPNKWIEYRIKKGTKNIEFSKDLTTMSISYYLEFRTFERRDVVDKIKIDDKVFSAKDNIKIYLTSWLPCTKKVPDFWGSYRREEEKFSQDFYIRKVGKTYSKKSFPAFEAVNE